MHTFSLLLQFNAHIVVTVTIQCIHLRYCYNSMHTSSLLIQFNAYIVITVTLQDINPPHMSSETLKPVIPPFLPPPSFDLDSPNRPWRPSRASSTMTSIDSSMVTMPVTSDYFSLQKYGIKKRTFFKTIIFFDNKWAFYKKYKKIFGHNFIHTQCI